MIDLGFVIGCTDPTEYVVIREDEGETIDGLNRRRESATIKSTGVLVPLDPKRISELPEGHRVDQSRQYLSLDELRTADVKGRGRPDILVNGSERFRVHGVSKWPQGEFFDYVLVREGQ